MRHLTGRWTGVGLAIAFLALISPERSVLADEKEELDFPDDLDADFPDLVSTRDLEFLEEMAFLEEEFLVESAARHKQDIGMSPSAVWVLTRDDIQTSGATRLADLFRMVPGLEVLQLTPFYSSVVGRLVWSYSNNTILVLIDGRETNMELVGQALWGSQIVGIEDIEKIEIIRGPGSSLYGANALAGVISITTRKIEDQPTGSVWFNAGQSGIVQSNARASFRTGDLGCAVSGGIDWAAAAEKPGDARHRQGRLRAILEYRLSEDRRMILDLGVMGGPAPLASAFGEIETQLLIFPINLAYKSKSLVALLSWTPMLGGADIEVPLEYAGIYLADFVSQEADIQLVDGKLQWKVPRFWEPLLLITGGRFRASFVRFDRGLDAETYSDPNSDRFHQEGLDILEIRTGAYLHSELSVSDWLTITSGIRLDYNNSTGLFPSPRLAAVFRPVKGHFIRLAAARAFRMPSAWEGALHLSVDFPDESPFQGESQQIAFREFATRIIGNENVSDEALNALEAGYRGEFWDGKLSVNLELYFNQYVDQLYLLPRITTDSLGLPDLTTSTAQFENTTEFDSYIFGSELALRYRPSRNVYLTAAWSHREIYRYRTEQADDGSPKNYLTLGCGFRTESGFTGSLFLFGRGRFTDNYVSNPKGVLEEYLKQKMDDYLLVMGRLGYSWTGPLGLRLQAGLKLYLPVVPFDEPHFRYREKGGGETVTGQYYGADQLQSVVTLFFQGSI